MSETVMKRNVNVTEKPIMQDSLRGKSENDVSFNSGYPSFEGAVTTV
jgi:hypothetical protein